MWLILVSGIGLWLLLATIFIAMAVSAARGDVVRWVDEREDDLALAVPLRDAA